MKLNQIIIVAVIIAILCMGGCGVYQYGIQTGKQQTELSVIDNIISADEDSVTGLVLKIRDLNDSVKKVNTKYDSVLKVHSRFQIGANIQRNAYVRMIKSLSDSIKAFKVDSIQLSGNSEQLNIAYLNYPIISNQLDTCIKDNEIKDSIIAGKDLKLKMCNRLNTEQSKLISDLNTKISLMPKKRPLLTFLKRAGVWCLVAVTTVESTLLYLKK